MGGSTKGNFGKTKGALGDIKGILDSVSDFLTLASWAPGVDSLIDILAIPVDLLRGDFLSAGLDLIGIIPYAGEIADGAKLVKMADKASDTVKATKKIDKGKDISNVVSKSKRVGSAMKGDAHHAFPNVIDNYASKAKSFALKGADGKTRKLYQIKGSLNGKSGVFEWIVDAEKGVTHRRFIPNGKITGKPNSR